MKRKLLVLGGMLVMAVGIVFISAQNSKQKSSDLLVQNIEAMAQNELPAGWEKGTKMTGVFYVIGGSCTKSCSAGVTLSSDGTVTCSASASHSVTIDYERLNCCVSSDDRNACDTNASDEKCKYQTL